MRRWILKAGLLTALGVMPLAIACGDSKDEPGGDGDAGSGSGDGDGDTSGDGDLNLGGNMFGDGDMTGDGDGDECEGEGAEASLVPVNVLLVVDTSASMDATPDGFDDTKWNTLVDSLGTSLEGVQDKISMGLKFFPSGDTGSDVCSVETGVEVEVGAGTEVLSNIEEALSAQSPSGDTPTAVALSDALDYFQNANLEGDNIVLLATDGGPNCNDAPEVDCSCKGNPDGDVECGIRERCTINIDEVIDVCTVDGDWGSCCDQPKLCLDDGGTLDAVEALADAGILTIVLGMPGSEAYTEVLDSLADAGGLALADGDTKYHKVEDPDGLTEAIDDITRGVIKSCELQLEKEPPPGKINVYVDGAVVPQDDSDGWRLNEDTDPPTVELVGPLCDQVEEEGVEKISVEFGCDTIIR